MASNKRVVFFSVFPPFRGGISKFSNALAKVLHQSSDLTSINFKTQYPSWLFPGKTQFSTEKPYLPLKRVGSTFNFFSFFKLTKTIQKRNPEILICSYWVTFMAPILSFIAKRQNKNCEKILLVHNFKPHESRFFDGYMNRMVLRSFDRFIVLSEAVKKDILSTDSEANIQVARHPVYNDFNSKMERSQAIQKLGIHPSKRTILFFGLIREYKGLDLLLEAFSYLSEDYQLIIAGEVYGDSLKYQNLITNSKNKNIFFHNYFIPEDKVHYYFSAANLCVLPYKSGTQSGVKSTADFFGVPCLLSKVGGIADNIEHGNNGFLLSSMDAYAMSKQIDAIFENCNLSELGRNIELNIRQSESSWEKLAEQILDQ